MNSAQGESLYFCHIPKTAGTSVRYLLESVVEEDQTYPLSADIRHPRGYPLFGDFVGGFVALPTKPRLVRGHYHLSCGRLLGENAKSLVIFRDPVARVVSELKVLVGLQGFGQDRLRRSMDSGIVPNLDNLQTRMVRGDIDVAEPNGLSDRHHLLITEPIGDETRALEEAMAAVSSCGFYGTVEGLGPLMTDVLDYLGAPRTQVPRENTAEPIDLGLTPVDLELIAERNALDARLYEEVRKQERVRLALSEASRT